PLAPPRSPLFLGPGKSPPRLQAQPPSFAAAAPVCSTGGPIRRTTRAPHCAPPLSRNLWMRLEWRTAHPPNVGLPTLARPAPTRAPVASAPAQIESRTVISVAQRPNKSRLASSPNAQEIGRAHV